jgi:hypothetical protein
MTDTFSVRVEKPTDVFGTLMNDIRAWLDNNKIEPIECKTTSLPDAAVAIDIRFARQGEADLFQQAFRL